MLIVGKHPLGGGVLSDWGAEEETYTRSNEAIFIASFERGYWYLIGY